MEVEGDGDAKIVQAPQFEVPESLEKYEPSVLRDETFAKGDRIRMLKEFEYIFVPEKDTIVTIAPEFTFLSVATGKFVTTIKPLKLSCRHCHRTLPYPIPDLDFLVHGHIY